MGERAVLTLAVLPSVVGGVLQEGHEVGDAHDVDPCRPELRLEGKPCQNHVPTVRAAPESGPVGVEAGTGKPVVHGCKVADGVEASRRVVECGVALPVPGGSPNIGHDDRVTGCCKALDDRVEGEHRLRLGPPVDHHHDRRTSTSPSSGGTRKVGSTRRRSSWFVRTPL